MKIHYTPILIISVLYIVGIILQHLFSIPLYIPIIILFICLLIFILKKQWKILYFSACLIGIINTYIAEQNYFQKKISSFFNKRCSIQGKICSLIINKKSRKFTLKVNQIDQTPVRGKIMVFCRPKLNLKKHDNLIIKGKIQSPSGSANFGEIDYGLYYKQIQIDGTLFIKKKSQIKSINSINKYSLYYIAHKIQQDIQTYLTKYYYTIQKSFLKGLLLGQRSEIPHKIKQIFINTGTIHLLAISGLHVGIITLILLTIFININLPRRFTFILSLFFLILYNFIIGYKPPILRSTLMFGFILLCYFFDRDRDYLNNLSLAGLIILLINPLALHSLSFQLSFLATLGIILFTPVINQWIDLLVSIKSKPLNYIKNIITGSFSAQLLIFPFLIHHFHQFASIFIITNLFAISLTTCILTFSILGYIFYHIIPYITLLFSKINNFLIAFLIYLLNIFNNIKPLKIDHFNWILIIPYLLILFILFKKRFINKSLILLDNKKIKSSIITGLLIFIIGISIFSGNTNLSDKKNRELLFFNIKGESILLKTSTQKIILIDTGFASDMHKTITPFLKRNNIKKIDYLITSNILDHRTMAVPYLLNHFPVKQYLDSGYVPSYYRYERIMEIISKKNIPYRILTSGSKMLIDQIEIKILNPPETYFKSFHGEHIDIKNNSLVIKIRYKNQNILLCSDIQKRVVNYLKTKINKKESFLIVNIPIIYNSKQALSDLLQLTNPQYVIINNPLNVYYKNIKKRVSETLEHHNIIPFYTYQGAVKIKMDKHYKIITSQ